MKAILASILFFLLPFLPALAQVIKVSQDMGTIQDALNAASAGDSVVVLPGTYYENLVWPNTQGITLISEVGPDSTIIDGSSSANVILINSGIDTTTKISGFSIKNGYTPSFGAGIYCSDNSSPIIENNYIFENTSDSLGGGIGCDNSSPKIVNNAIVFNEANFGGGIFLKDCATVFVNNNYIIGNNANIAGGGISISNSEMVMLALNSLYDNSAQVGGGIAVDFSEIISQSDTISSNIASNAGAGIFSVLSNVKIQNSSIVDNQVIDGDGGGIIFQADQFNNGVPFKLELIDCELSFNTARSGAGVRVDNWHSDSLVIDVEIDKCRFIENNAENTAGLSIRHSSFYLSNSIFHSNTSSSFSGGANFINKSKGKVWNCLFSSNVAANGGGNFNSGGVSIWAGSKVNFINCTIVDNYATYGAGLTVGPEGFVTATNCIFWGNDVDQIALATFNNFGGTITINYCDVQGGESSVNVFDTLSTLNWGIENVDSDPSFLNPGNNNYQLQNSSVCISTGIDKIELGGEWYYCPDDDIVGNPRPNPYGSMPDLGAYESPEGIVGIDDNELNYPKKYKLIQNYPNPFNPKTKIEYSVPQTSNVVIKVFDILGNEIETLVNEEKPTGTFEITWSAANLPSGIYFYRLQAGSFIDTKKMILLK